MKKLLLSLLLLTTPALAQVQDDTGARGAFTPNRSASGALGALNAAVTVDVSGRQGVGGFIATGTLSGTVTPEVTIDGTNWIATSVYTLSAGATPTRAASVALNTLFGIELPPGAKQARVRVSAYTSGSSTGTLIATETAGAAAFQPTQPVSASSFPLPTGAATLAEQQTQTTSLQKIDNVAHAGADVALSEHVPISGQLDDTSPTTVTENQVAPARISPERSIYAELRTGANEAGTSSNPVRTDPTGTTAQPVDTTSADQVTALISQAGSANDVDLASAIPVTATGTLTGASQSVTIDVGGYGSAAIQLTGTWTATVGFDATVDGSTWVDLQVVPAGSTSAVLTTTANGVWYVNAGGLDKVRVFSDAFTSGTVTVTMQANIASGKPTVASGGAGGTSATDDTAFTGGSTAVTPAGALYDTTPPTIADGNVGAPRMNVNRDLRVQAVDGQGDSAMDDANNAHRVAIVAGGGSGGTAQADESAFTEGTTSFTPVGGVLNDTPASDPTEDQAAAARITPKRAVHSNLRNQAGTEIGTATNPVRTDPTGTTTQPISVASLPLPSGAATSANQSTEITSLQLIDDLPLGQGSTTSGQSGVLAQGAVTTAAPTYTTGQTNPLSLQTDGDLRTAAQVESFPDNEPVAQGTPAAGTAPWPVKAGNVAAVTAAWTSATSDETTLTLAVTGYSTVVLSLNATSTMTAGQIEFEGNDGGSVWYARQGLRSGTTTLETFLALSVIDQLWQFNVAGLTDFRVRLSTVITGTGTANLRLQASEAVLSPYTTIQGTTTANVGTFPDNEPVNVNQWGGTSTTLGQKAMSASVPTVLASDQTAIPVDTTSADQVTALGNKSNNGGAPSSTNLGTLPAVANAAAPTHTEGNQVALRAQLDGDLVTVMEDELPAGTQNIGDVDVASFPDNEPINAAQRGGTAVVAGACERESLLYVQINQTAGTQLITGTASERIYICSIQLITALGQNIALVDGTGTVCATAPTGLLGGSTAATGWNYAANGGIVLPATRDSWTKTSTDADNVCLLQSGAGQVSGSLTYVSLPNI